MKHPRKLPTAFNRSLVALTLVLLAGCTTNSVVIGYFYGRLDNRMIEQILDVASFDDQQEQVVRESVNGFFSWHRRESLPRYAGFLDRMREEVERGGVDQALVLSHFDTVRDFASNAFTRSPFFESGAFLAGLTDQQVAEIEAHFEQEDKEFEEWLEERQQEGGESKRVDNIVKNIGRFGVNLNDDQRQIIARGMSELQGDPQDRHALWNRWEATLIEILGRRDQSGFVAEVNAHLAAYQDQMRIHQPQIREQNQKISARMIEQVVVSLDPRQRAALIDRLAQTARSLRKLANR